MNRDDIEGWFFFLQFPVSIIWLIIFLPLMDFVGLPHWIIATMVISGFVLLVYINCKILG